MKMATPIFFFAEIKISTRNKTYVNKKKMTSQEEKNSRLATQL